MTGSCLGGRGADHDYARRCVHDRGRGRECGPSLCRASVYETAELATGCARDREAVLPCCESVYLGLLPVRNKRLIPTFCCTNGPLSSPLITTTHSFFSCALGIRVRN